MLYRALLLTALCVLFSGVAHAQNQQSKIPDGNASADKNSPDNDPDELIGTPEEEMLKRREIRYEEQQRKENVERAREVAQLSAELRDIYAQHQRLTPGEIKKLDRLEKLARKIRSEAGGSDGDVTLDHAPQQLEQALARLAETAEQLRKGVEKTPRQVISANVIENANELLEVIRYVRNLIH